jgi:predicted flap endonuclease-1-like 5' DNA nuclease
MLMNRYLSLRPLLSTLDAQAEPPAFDPFPGVLQPFAAVLLVVGVVLVVWWLLRFQVGQVEPVELGHGHEDHGHGAEMKEVVSAAPAEAAPVITADELEKLEGVGPKVAAVFNEAGITTFAQLAAAEVADLQALLDAAGYAYMDPGSWPEQARLAAAGDWEALQKLQDELTAGK